MPGSRIPPVVAPEALDYLTWFWPGQSTSGSASWSIPDFWISGIDTVLLSPDCKNCTKPWVHNSHVAKPADGVTCPEMPRMVVGRIRSCRLAASSLEMDETWAPLLPSNIPRGVNWPFFKLRAWPSPTTHSQALRHVHRPQLNRLSRGLTWGCLTGASPWKPSVRPYEDARGFSPVKEESRDKEVWMKRSWDG